MGVARLGVMHSPVHAIEEEEVDYRPVYDPGGIDVTKTKESEGIHDPFLSINERTARTDNISSHMYVGPGFEEPLDDDLSTEDEIARVDSYIESSNVEEEDFEMGEAAFAPTNDEDWRSMEFFFHYFTLAPPATLVPPAAWRANHPARPEARRGAPSVRCQAQRAKLVQQPCSGFLLQLGKAFSNSKSNP
ncbi:hypothetical protein HAX54_017173 [Datura stramonium]|uniref:Uncharacterized protein n=1 Tax=Datura stramonium TaxID=4076 RepID=A0ABS8UK94_DATST|nr:hypothetical protein [Datura stramonium]